MLEEFYDSVGNGWRSILEALDSQMLRVLGEIPPPKILQVKEKFGGLRVYLGVPGEPLPKELVGKLYLLIDFAEDLSFRTCEECSDTRKVETRVRKGVAYASWVKTLCEEHHAERDAGIKIPKYSE